MENKKKVVAFVPMKLNNERKLKSIFLTALNFLKEAKALTHQAL